MRYCSECEDAEGPTRMQTDEELADLGLTADEAEEVCECGAELQFFDEDRGRDR